MMDDLYLLMPLSGVEVLWPALALLGVATGVIGGFFGLGGSWIFAPALYTLGFPMAWAIGTTIAEVAGKSLLTTLRQGSIRHLDPNLGLTMLIGTVIGVELGARMVMWLENIGRLSLVVLSVYAFLLAFLCWLVIHDLLTRNRFAEDAEVKPPTSSEPDTAHAPLQKLRIPPIVNYKKANITCSAWGPLLICLVTGFVAGFLGIGGGLLRMPALVYLAGFPTALAQGTDLMEAAVSGIYGACSYAAKMRVEPYAALILIFCAAVGSQLGSLATRYARGRDVRLMFGLTGLICLLAVAVKLAELFLPEFGWLMSPLALAVLLIGLSLVAVYIIWALAHGYCRRHEARQ